MSPNDNLLAPFVLMPPHASCWSSPDISVLNISAPDDDDGSGSGSLAKCLSRVQPRTSYSYSASVPIDGPGSTNTSRSRSGNAWRRVRVLNDPCRSGALLRHHAATYSHGTETKRFNTTGDHRGF